MEPMTNWIDASVWTGKWPFMHLRYERLDALKNKLQSLGASRALVAPLEAVFEQDPMRANKQLLRDVKDDFFSPVPVADLSYANWRDVIGLAVSDGRVGTIRLLPNYHMYEINEEVLAPLVELTQKHRLLIAIQMRMEDRRGQYPLLQVEDVDALKLIKVLSFFPEQTFLLHHLFRKDMLQSMHSLDHVYADFSGVEDHEDTLLFLKREFGSLDKFVFATHSPIYFPEGNLFKLKLTRADQDDVVKVSRGNMAKLLGIR